MIGLILTISIIANILFVIGAVLNSSSITELQETIQKQFDEIQNLVSEINHQHVQISELRNQQKKYTETIEQLKKQVPNEKEVKEEVIKAKRTKTTKATSTTKTNKKTTKKEAE